MVENLREYIAQIIAHANAVLDISNGPLSDDQVDHLQTIIRHAQRFESALLKYGDQLMAMWRGGPYVDISHPLGNPVTPIVGFSWLLLTESAGALTSAQARHVEAIQQLGHTISSTISEIVRRAQQ